MQLEYHISKLSPLYLPRSISSNHDCVYFFNPFLGFRKFLRHILQIHILIGMKLKFIYLRTLLRVYITLTFQSSFLVGYNFEN